MLFLSYVVLHGGVHGLCTPRTWALYSPYMGFLLWHEPRGVDVSSVFLRREGAGLPSLVIAAGEINLCHIQCFGNLEPLDKGRT